MKPRAPTSGRVTGLVTGAENRAPLTGASLKLKGTKFETRVDAGGAFELSDVPPGRYQVECTCPGHQKFTAPVVVRAGQLTRIQCQPRRGTRLGLHEPLVLLPLRLEIRRHRVGETGLKLGRYAMEAPQPEATASGRYRDFSARATIQPAKFERSEYWIRWYPDEIHNRNYVGRFTTEEREAWEGFSAVYERHRTVAVGGESAPLDLAKLEIYHGVRPGRLTEEELETAQSHDAEAREQIASTGLGVRKALGWRDLENPELRQAWVEFSQQVGPVRALQIARHMTRGGWEFDTTFPFLIDQEFGKELEQGIVSDGLRAALDDRLPHDLPSAVTVTSVMPGSEWRITETGTDRSYLIKRIGTSLRVDGTEEGESEPLEMLLDRGIPLPTLPARLHLYTVKDGTTCPLMLDLPVNRDELRLAPTELEGTHWLTDFDRALAEGMGVKVTDPELVQQIDEADWLTVMGVDGSEPSRAALEELLRRNNALGELSIVPQDAATNNTEDRRTPHTENETDIERLLRSTRMRLDLGEVAPEIEGGEITERRPGDAELLRELLALDPAAVSEIAGADLVEQAEARALARLLWLPLTVAYRRKYMKNAGSGDDLRTHFVANVRPRGPFPVVRVGENPYGILPVISMRDWSTETRGIEDELQKGLAGLKSEFLEMTSAVPRLGRAPEDDPYDTLVEILKTNPSSNRVDVRKADTTRTVDIGTHVGSTLKDDTEYLACPLVKDPAGAEEHPTDGTFGETAYLSEFSRLDSPDPSQMPLDARSPVLKRLLHYALLSLKLRRSSDPPAELEHMQHAVDLLKRVPPARLELQLTGLLDLFTNRLDAWVTSLATARLKQCPEYGKRRPPLGVYGWLEKPGQLETIDPQPEFIQAPSMQQAVSAALLRSAATSNGPGEEAGAFQVNLSSTRVRTGADFLESIRRGHQPEELLGAALERAIREEAKKKGSGVTEADIYKLRDTYPLPLQEAPNEVRTAIDGVRFLKKNKDAKYKRVREIVDSIRDSAADLAVFEAVDQTVRGNYARVGAWLDFLEGESPPPELESIRSQRSGDLHGTRIFLPLVSDGHPTGEPSGNPRVLADPIVAAWCGRLLPDFGDKQVVVRISRTDTAASRQITVTPSELGMEPIDLVIGGVEELNQRVRYHVLKRWKNSDSSDARSDFAVLGPFPEFEVSDELLNEVGVELDLTPRPGDPCIICDSIETAARIRRLLHSRQSRDTPVALSPVEMPIIPDETAARTDAVASLEELAVRVQRVLTQLCALLATTVTTALDLKIARVVQLSLDRLLADARRLRSAHQEGEDVGARVKELRSRLARVFALSAGAGPPSDWPAIAADLDALRPALGGDEEAAQGLFKSVERGLAEATKRFQERLAAAGGDLVTSHRLPLLEISRYGLERALTILPDEPTHGESVKITNLLDELVNGLRERLRPLYKAAPDLVDRAIVLAATFVGLSKLNEPLREEVGTQTEIVDALARELQLSKSQAALLHETYVDSGRNPVGTVGTLSALIADPARSTWVLRDRAIAFRALLANPQARAQSIVDTEEEAAVQATMSGGSLSEAQARLVVSYVNENAPFDPTQVAGYLEAPIEESKAAAIRFLQKATDGDGMVILTPHYLQAVNGERPAWKLSFDGLEAHSPSFLEPYSPVRTAVRTVLSLFANEPGVTLYEDRREQREGEDGISGVAQGTEDYLYLAFEEEQVGECLTGLVIDEFREGFPEMTQTTGIALRYEGPKAEAPQAILIAVPPWPDNRQEWTSDLLARTLLETIELFQIRMITSDEILRSGRSKQLPTLVFGPDAAGDFLFPSWDRWSLAIDAGSAVQYVLASEAQGNEGGRPGGSAIRRSGAEIDR